ncbi:MAG: hypothetical protein WD315_01845 [Balneolaceae bacterium]
MKNFKMATGDFVFKLRKTGWMVFLFVLVGANTNSVLAQRAGALPGNSLVNRLLISDGPGGPIKGGESAVTDMLLMSDDWVYGSTKATWGAENAHLFRTDGETLEHVLNVTSNLPEQTMVSDLNAYKENLLVGSTSTYNEIFDDEDNSYEGGHLFLYDPGTDELEDLGIIAPGQGINCIAVDQNREIVYGVTYPAGHLFSFDLSSKSVKDFGEVMTPWRVEHLGRVSWRGVPKVLMIDDAGTIYYSTYYREGSDPSVIQEGPSASSSYSTKEGGRIYRLAYGDEEPVYTGANIPVQTGMDSNPIYENGIASAIRANDGGFWAGTINDGFLFKFYPSTSTVINKGKAFQYWNLKSLTYGGDGKLYMLGGRDYDNTWLLNYDPGVASINSLGWPDHGAQGSRISTDKKGRVLIAENRRHSYIWVYEPENLNR